MLRYCKYLKIFFLISSSIIFISIFLVGNNHFVNRNILVTIKTTPVVFIKPNRVTKSMKEIFETSGLNDHVVFFNRIPKSGAELLLLVLQNIKGLNAFLHVRLKGIRNVLDVNEQRALVEEVQQKIKEEAVPIIFDRSMYFVNFTKFGEPSPTFINFVRNPIDIVLSRLQYQIKDKFSNEQIIDLNLCILNNYFICNLNNYADNYFAVPYFCGQADFCSKNSRRSLTQAKRNVENYFPVVGILEELNATLEVLDKKLPYFFRGARRFYEHNLMDKIPTRLPIIVSDQAEAIIKDEIFLEYEFYKWLKNRLFSQIKNSLAEN